MKLTSPTGSLIFAFCLLACTVAGQGVGVNTAGTPAHPSAILDVSSSTQGLLTPRMTEAERDAIVAPATGLLIYQTDLRPGFRFFDGTEWLFLRGMTSIPGRIEVEPGCISAVVTPSAYSGFSVSYDCTNGNGQVAWPAGLFNNNPVVNMSSAVVKTPTPAPDIYCIPSYSAGCGPFINNDHILGVRIWQSTTGTGGPFTQIMERMSECDAPTNGNYFAVPEAVATATLNGNIGGACGSNNFYRVEVRSSLEWNDWVQAFIDWNADGDFFDAQEFINGGSFGMSQGNWVMSPSFQVPSFALNGKTVMRVRSLWVNNNNPCQGATYGDTEDYTLTISCATDGPAPEIPSICTVTNVSPVSFDFNCTLLSGFAADPPLINFDLVPTAE